jgi:hypothetical protein
MSSRCMSLLPRATLHSDSEQVPFSIYRIPETWRPRHETRRDGHGDMDTETWTRRLGHGDMDTETWTQKHGHEDMDTDT